MTAHGRSSLAPVAWDAHSGRPTRIERLNSERVLELAYSVAPAALDIEALKAPDVPTTDLRKQFLSIKEVGKYAVAHLLMLPGRCDFAPVDSWAVKMVSRE